MGKSTLAETLILNWTEEYEKSRTIILDTKPRFKAEYELNGVPCSVSRRYRNWDWGETIPGSVVLPLGANIRQEIKDAWRFGFRIIIAQIEDRNDILKLSEVVKWGYMDRTKGRPIFFYFDELNNFWRARSPKAIDPIITTITSGGERSVGWLGAAQRPRWIGVEALESLTKVWWFKTPFGEDVKHLRNMGIPENAIPPKDKYVFYFYDRNTNMAGMATVPPHKKITDRKMKP